MYLYVWGRTDRTGGIPTADNHQEEDPGYVSPKAFFSPDPGTQPPATFLPPRPILRLLHARSSLPCPLYLFQYLFHRCSPLREFIDPILAFANVLTEIVERLRVGIGCITVLFVKPFRDFGYASGRRVYQDPVALAHGIVFFEGIVNHCCPNVNRTIATVYGRYHPECYRYVVKAPAKGAFSRRA